MPSKKPVDQYRVLVALLLVASILFLTYLAFRNYKVEKYEEDSEKVTVVLIHASWCGHCVSYIKSGIFDSVAKSNTNSKISFESWENSKVKDKINKYDVNGFPTIIAIDANGNKIMDFNGNRNNPTELMSFAEKALAATKAGSGASASK